MAEQEEDWVQEEAIPPHLWDKQALVDQVDAP
jgi:hypothetical protein